MADEAIEEVRGFIKSSYGDDFLPGKPVVYKTKKSAQDAHEAIRPTSPERTPQSVKSYLSRDEFNLYQIIWKRFVASQMTPAVMDVTAVDVKADDYTLRATGSILKFAGFLKVYEETSENETDDDKEKRLPEDIATGDAIKLLNLDRNQHFTQPPPRYSEATLIRALEEFGVGRPSTYAGIVMVIQEREYCTSEDRKLAPTEMGKLVTELLTKSFPDILNVEFTAKMEEELDQVEEGKKEWTKTLDDFYKPFVIDLERAKVEMRNVKTEAEKTDELCDKCGKEMVIKFGRFGKFLACTGYPDCKSTKNITKDGKVVPAREQLPDEPTEYTCQKCSKPMVKKHGRFGEFIACSDYPTCKTTRQIGIGIDCPKEDCKGELVKKVTKRRKAFYGCGNYPDCDFAVWDEPIDEKCPTCKHPFLIKKILKKGTFYRCPEKECDYERQIEETESQSSAED